MGPIEILFLALIAVFGAIGLVRGHARELGVTVMLLIGLWILSFADDMFNTQVDQVLGLVAENEANRASVKALLYSGFLLLLTFTSYQGFTLSFSGSRGNPLLGLLTGLINGYLFAGSVWYYLSQANYPFVNVSTNYSPLYRTLVQFLPPAIFPWEYLIGMAVLMLILRVLR